MIELTRTVVIGNSGAGKSWLAARLSRVLSAPAIDLDTLHWEPGGYGVERDEQKVSADVRAATKADLWIIEGVYGWLAEMALPRASALIWLNFSIEECLSNLRARGVRGGGTEDEFISLLNWASEYRVRANSNSWAGHKRIFDDFGRAKWALSTRLEVEDFLDQVTP